MRGDNRSAIVKRNILLSSGLKIINILITLQIVPLTINYVDPDRYGLWLTISSIVSWLAYFDFGFANGFRNKFTAAKSNGDSELAKAYVSTTYAGLGLIFGSVFICALIVNYFLNWNKILNISLLPNTELQTLFAILVSFFCLNIVFNVFNMMLTADQKPALASLISTTGQLLGFIGVYLLTLFTKGNLIYLALCFSGIPCVVLLVTSFVSFRCSRYRSVSPSLKYVRMSLVKSIIGLGGKFFVIMMSMLFIYQFINIILARIEGPYAVTQYNIAYKYFNLLFMGYVIILNPFWSATTEAYIKKDLAWIRRVISKLEKLWICTIPILCLMVVFSTPIYNWWIGKSVTIPVVTSIALAIFILFQLIANIYMYIINGIGKVKVQLIIYLCFAIIALPLMNLGCKLYGIEGILVIPTLVYIIQAIFGKIQLNKILNNSASGVWAQ